MKIGLIGCGSIGKTIADRLLAGEVDGSEIVCVLDSDLDQAMRFIDEFAKNAYFTNDIDDFLEREYDIVIEAASQDAVKEYVCRVLECGFDVMILSVGALLDKKLFKDMLNITKKVGCHVYIPSGAISGLDGIKAASLGKIKHVRLRTIKPPSSFKEVSYLQNRGVKLDKISKPITVFKGSANDAVRFFPKNINVCAILSIVTLGSAPVEVEIVIDPTINTNIHEIHVSGEFGDIFTRTSNKPSIRNPKTSYLAGLSAVRTLKNIKEKILIGT